MRKSSNIKIIIILLLTFYNWLIAASDNKTIDSLHQVYGSSKNEKKVDVLNKLNDLYLLKINDLKNADLVNNEALELSTKLDYKYGFSEALLYKAEKYFVLKEWQKSLDIYTKVADLKEALNDSLRLGWVYISLGLIHRELMNYQEAEKFYKKALKVSENLKNYSKVIVYLKNLGNLYFEQGKYYEADSVLARILLISQQSNDSKTKVSTLIDLANIYASIGNKEKSLSFLAKGDSLLGAERKPSLNSELNLAYANTYYTFGEFDSSIKYYLKVLDYHESIKDSLSIANIKLELANSYDGWRNREKALSYYHEALQYFTENDMESQKSIVLNNLGHVHYRLKQYDKALNYFEQSLSIEEKLNRESSKTTSLLNIGTIYRLKGDLDKALNFLNEGKEYSKKFNNKQDYIYSNLGIAYIYAKKHLKDSVYTLANEALDLSEKLSNNEVTLDTYQELAGIYEILGDFKKAYNYYKNYADKKDEIFTEEKNLQISEMETKYDSERKSKEIAILKKDSEIQQIIRYALIVIIILIAVIIIVVFFRLKSARKYNKILRTQKKELQASYDALKKAQDEIVNLERKNSVLAMVVTTNHELNQPLTVLKGNLYLLKKHLENFGIESDKLKYFDKAEEALKSIEKTLKKYRDIEDKEQLTFKAYAEDTYMINFDASAEEESK